MFHVEQFEKYQDVLLEWNEKINLTAITDKTGISIDEICEKFDLAIYCDAFENIHQFDMFELITALGKERARYLEEHEDIITYKVPMTVLNEMCRYQSSIDQLPSVVKGDVIVMGFDCNKWALRELLEGNWNYDGQCSPFQAAVIEDMIKTGKVPSKKVISEEKGFDAKTITKADIDTYGLGD